MFIQTKIIPLRTSSTEELRLSEIRFRELFNNMDNGVAIYTTPDNGTTFTVVDMNKAGLIASQIEREDIIGKSVVEVFPGIIEMGLLEVFKRVWSTKQAESFPVTEYKDPTIRAWYENFVYTLPSGELVVIYTDKTEEKQRDALIDTMQLKLEDTLNLQVKNLDMILSFIPDFVLYKDLDGKIIFANQSFADFVGVTVDELAGQRSEDILPMENSERAKEWDLLVKHTKQPQTFRSSITVNGKTKHNLITKTPVFDKENIFVGIVTFFRDISNVVEAEEKLHKIQNIRGSLKAIKSLVQISKLRDNDTGNHIFRVSSKALLILSSLVETNFKEVDIESDEKDIILYFKDLLEVIGLAIRAHDIGKVGIRDDILLLEGPLSAEQFEIMKQHVDKGIATIQERLENEESSAYKKAYTAAHYVIRDHHRHVDGRGYPQLEDTPLSFLGRLTALVDAHDAMSHDRVYSKAKPKDVVWARILNDSGKHFDPKIVQIALTFADQFEEIDLEYPR